MLVTLLWIIVAIVLIVWLFGLIVPFAGSLIWILLVIAAIIILINLLAVPRYRV
ncbi:MAG: DUF5670 family protein [Candidatus Marsarchaeota archaeon]|nr:DUF5670 family protein [Candidatus Marsarchaeota archaeon]